MRRRRVTYRPSRANGVLGIVFGCVFVLIGIFFVIPGAGPFGVLWTALAAVITVYNAYVAFGKKYIGPEINIEDETPETQNKQPASDIEQRLEQLNDLHEKELITDEEYEKKRQEILDEL